MQFFTLYVPWCIFDCSYCKIVIDDFNNNHVLINYEINSSVVKLGCVYIYMGRSRDEYLALDPVP